jgi:hypothetical protein
MELLVSLARSGIILLSRQDQTMINDDSAWLIVSEIGNTVITTIHQPNNFIFERIDLLCLISGGWIFSSSTHLFQSMTLVSSQTDRRNVLFWSS